MGYMASEFEERYLGEDAPEEVGVGREALVFIVDTGVIDRYVLKYIEDF